MSTYTQLHIHVVFSTLNREPLISPKWEDDLFKYITGITTKYHCKLLAINGTKDHIHILIGLSTQITVSKLIREIKTGSTHYINQCIQPKFKFNWQEGYGAFSYSKSQIPRVIRYIENQKTHHSKLNSRDELIDILEGLNVDYDERFVK